MGVVEETMSNLDYDTLDHLFFVGIPIVDADVRERFRRLWYDKPYWSTDSNNAKNYPSNGVYNLGSNAYSNIPDSFTGNFKSIKKNFFSLFFF